MRLYDYDHGSITDWRAGAEGYQSRRGEKRVWDGAAGSVSCTREPFARTWRSATARRPITKSRNRLGQPTSTRTSWISPTAMRRGSASAASRSRAGSGSGWRSPAPCSRHPTFLVLDDSLSAVDTKTESRILQSLAARKGKQTTILIAHRLSSARLADRVFVLDGGRLIQEGTHDELLASDGLYRRLMGHSGRAGRRNRARFAGSGARHESSRLVRRRLRNQGRSAAVAEAAGVHAAISRHGGGVHVRCARPRRERPLLPHLDRAS